MPGYGSAPRFRGKSKNLICFFGGHNRYAKGLVMAAEELTPVSRVLTRGGPLVVMVLGVVFTLVNRDTIFSLAGVGAFVAGALGEMYVYLQSASPSSGFSSKDNDIERLKAEIAAELKSIAARQSQTGIADTDNRLMALQVQVETTEARMEDRLSKYLMNEQDRSKVIETTITALSNQSAKTYLEEWEKILTNRVLQNSRLDRIREISSSVQTRLRDEVFKLGRRAAIQLIIGVAISLLGLAVLAWFVFTIPLTITEPTNRPELWFYFATRVTVVLFIEVFAYFFLRLYRYSIFEIKNFQNEITTSNFRVIALEGAMSNGDKNTVNKICIEMGKTERNFILKKGETTLAIRSAEMEQGGDRNVGNYLERFLQTLQKSASSAKVV
jgi:hypothetical protein